ncbi:uncharacterized protein I206_107221 [Kwoniella pini CBS 10737]|uniref:Uncharacterized protein n=1 Tax=Kwoniella pini CBS 10737 TaxID=1296096 RepID=A0A1B9HYW1_9TREE|nr:uncharacterized protein I206_05235 [Kwoniella pini CBS 10737]OCF48456.1 hypothetical protein I206_05235 [Kwoniella pini CBS 10737]
MIFPIFLLGILPSSLAVLTLSSIPSPTPTASPGISLNSAIFPSTTKIPNKRCEGDCTFGGTATTLEASIVTSTILSTTSVPCYITTYITNSKTITETIYSTEILTSTITKEGTIFIIQYSPTPILMSTEFTSIMEITNTFWSFWITSTGDYSTSTSSGSEITYGGEVNSNNSND